MALEGTFQVEVALRGCCWACIHHPKEIRGLTQWMFVHSGLAETRDSFELDHCSVHLLDAFSLERAMKPLEGGWCCLKSTPSILLRFLLPVYCLGRYPHEVVSSGAFLPLPSPWLWFCCLGGAVVHIWLAKNLRHLIGSGNQGFHSFPRGGCGQLLQHGGFCNRIV